MDFAALNIPVTVISTLLLLSPPLVSHQYSPLSSLSVPDASQLSGAIKTLTVKKDGLVFIDLQSV